MGLNAAFVAETGSGLSSATSLLSVADFRTYWTARPLDAGAALTATDAEVQDALMLATRTVCADEFLGSRLTGEQALELPRYWPLIRGKSWDAMPSPILEAVCIYARYYLEESPNAPQDRGGAVQSEQVGPIATSYFEGAPAGKRFETADELLAPFLDDAAGQNEMELG